MDNAIHNPMINIRCLASDDPQLDLPASALLLLRRIAVSSLRHDAVIPLVFDSCIGIRSVLLVEQLNVS